MRAALKSAASRRDAGRARFTSKLFPNSYSYKGKFSTFNVWNEHWQSLFLLKPALSFSLPGPHILQNGPKITDIFQKWPKKRYQNYVTRFIATLTSKNAKQVRKSSILGSQKWWFFALFLKTSILRKLAFRLDGSSIFGVQCPRKTDKNRWKNQINM